MKPQRERDDVALIDKSSWDHLFKVLKNPGSSLESFLLTKPRGSWQQFRSASLSPLPVPPTEASDLANLQLESDMPDVASPQILETLNSRTSLSNPTRYVPSSLLQLPSTSNPFDPDTNMRTMDRLYNASFYDFVRSEENVMLISRHLQPIMKEFDVKTCVNAVRWMTEGWCLESVAKLLKLVTRDWSPEACGLFLNLYTAGWNVSDINPAFMTAEQALRTGRLNRITFDRSLEEIMQDSTGFKWPAMNRPSKNAQMKLIAILSAGEESDTSAAFVKSLTITENWNAGKVTELVSFLDAVLEWDENYFRDFTQAYLDLVNQETRVSDLEAKKSTTGKLSFEYLAALYKTNLAMANYKLALADFKLSVASRSLQSHQVKLQSDEERKYQETFQLGRDLFFVVDSCKDEDSEYPIIYPPSNSNSETSMALNLDSLVSGLPLFSQDSINEHDGQIWDSADPEEASIDNYEQETLSRRESMETMLRLYASSLRDGQESDDQFDLSAID